MRETKRRIRFEHLTDGSAKFWEPRVAGSELVVSFGKNGTGGQERRKQFSSSEEALREYRKLVCKKLAKGYKPTPDTALLIIEAVAAPSNPRAIASSCIGEHVPEGMAQEICDWLTACRVHGMSSRQFEATLLSEDESLEALGTGGELWLDATNLGDSELANLYVAAVEGDGDRFVWVYNNGFVYIVALQGDPGARAIEVCALEEENCKDDEGVWINEWSPRLGPGAPIASLSTDGYAILRGGERMG